MKTACLTSLYLSKPRNWWRRATQIYQNLIKHLLCLISRQLHSQLKIEFESNKNFATKYCFFLQLGLNNDEQKPVIAQSLTWILFSSLDSNTTSAFFKVIALSFGSVIDASNPNNKQKQRKLLSIVNDW